jgi:AAA domain
MTTPAVNLQPERTIPDWKFFSGEEALLAPRTIPRWVIQDLVMQDSPTAVSGLPHAQKSLSWLCAAMESVTTHKVWQHFDSPNVNRVLFIETEDPEVLLRCRIQELAKGLGIKPEDMRDRFVAVAPGPFDIVNEGEDYIQYCLEKFQPDWFGSVHAARSFEWPGLYQAERDGTRKRNHGAPCENATAGLARPLTFGLNQKAHGRFCGAICKLFQSDSFSEEDHRRQRSRRSDDRQQTRGRRRVQAASGNRTCI